MNLQPLPPPRVDAARQPIVPSRDRLLTAILALDGAKLITGGVLYIDGGYHIID